ncbi:hypothetical protein JG687_00010099 [Phytophthora cactorum]|uniref:phosphoglycerate dehydrogenase n=1 Tax=Phytophthora cactorum TaxID=29920 RepID=A0A8T1U9F1_9STRA|nr:hypothetical protein JG687_00010099 [Phytophthora cactorum]
MDGDQHDLEVIREANVARSITTNELAAENVKNVTSQESVAPWQNPVINKEAIVSQQAVTNQETIAWQGPVAGCERVSSHEIVASHKRIANQESATSQVSTCRRFASVQASTPTAKAVLTPDASTDKTKPSDKEAHDSYLHRPVTYPLDKIKVVLLENIHPRAKEVFEREGYTVETHKRAMSGEELARVGGDAHILGIRSKTQLDPDFFSTVGWHEHRLWAVGCFCIGTNQVALPSAAATGIPVFNAPFSNTRSVAEKTLSEIIALHLIDIDAAKEAVESGKIAGMAVDVFPKEPAKNGEPFDTPLRGLPNVILTPHIGGSTEEAQGNIAVEVATKLVRYINDGSTTTSTNTPEIDMQPIRNNSMRILHMHQNVPGVLSKIHSVLSDYGINVTSQYLQSDPRHGYIALEVEKFHAKVVTRELEKIKETIFLRTII